MFRILKDNGGSPPGEVFYELGGYPPGGVSYGLDTNR